MPGLIRWSGRFWLSRMVPSLARVAGAGVDKRGPSGNDRHLWHRACRDRSAGAVVRRLADARSMLSWAAVRRVNACLTSRMAQRGLIGFVWVTLARAAVFSVKLAFSRYVDHMLDLGLDCSLHRDEAADGAASWLLVQIVEVPAILEPEREPVQRVERSGSTHGAAAPENNVPGIHGVSPLHQVRPAALE